MLQIYFSGSKSKVLQKMFILTAFKRVDVAFDGGLKINQVAGINEMPFIADSIEGKTARGAT
jgi:hypothetical protein